MSKISCIFFALLLVSVSCVDKKELEKAKQRCRSSLFTAEREITNKYHSVEWTNFDTVVQNEAWTIYKDGVQEYNRLRPLISNAATMEVTKEVKTYSGTVVQCKEDIALAVAKVTFDVFEDLEALYKRVTEAQ